MKSQADRSRAKRYRAVPAAKRTPEQRRFLAAYDEPETTVVTRARKPPVEVDVATVEPPAVVPPDLTSEPAGVVVTPEPRAAVEPREVPIRDASKPVVVAPPVADEHVHVGPCKPDCPACLGQLGSVTPYHCPRTGLDVWPEISDGTAETIAGALLGLIGRAAAWLGAVDHYEPPSTPEIKLMSRAIKAWIRRYVGGMARYDESIAPITTAGAYVGRLSRLPTKAREAT